MRDIALLGARLVVGGYLAVHGAQKLFGAFGGAGLDRAGAGFERMGLTPGKPMAALAAAGPGRLRLGPGLPRRLTVLAATAGAALTASSLGKLLSAGHHHDHGGSGGPRPA